MCFSYFKEKEKEKSFTLKEKKKNPNKITISKRIKINRSFQNSNKIKKNYQCDMLSIDKDQDMLRY